MSKGINTQPDPGKEYFLRPIRPAHRQYEALRAYFVEGVPGQEAASRFEYSTSTLYTLCREFRAGRIDFFPPIKPGPKHAPKQDATRERVIELRKQNYSVYDIQRILRAEKVSTSHVLIHRILQAEGFAKLPRRLDEERPPTPRPEPAAVADIRELNWEKFANFETEGAALFVLLPTIVQWKMDRWVRAAHLPGSKMIPALQSFLSLLALKLTGRERISHIMDICDDPGFALFAGINVLPKTTALSTYSYRITRQMTAVLLAKYVAALRSHHLAPGESFNLDFHAIPHRGNEAVLEKHYVSKRSRRERAVLAFLVQDGDTRALCYANAAVRRDGAAEEIIHFVEFWKETTGKLPPHLVFDSQLTTHAVLDKLDRMGIVFITLRKRGPSMMHQLQQIPERDWKRMNLHGVSRRYAKVHYIESRVELRPVHRPLRQIAVRGLGHDQPTIFLTNDTESKPAPIVERYAHRMLIENAIGENVDFFHLDALCSAIAIQVDFDVMLTLIGNALYRDLARKLPGFEAAQPKQIFRRFLNAPARVQVTDSEVHVHIRRCAHHPILIGSGALDAHPAVPWWGGRRLHLHVR